MQKNKKMVEDVTTYQTGHLLNMQAFKVEIYMFLSQTNQ